MSDGDLYFFKSNQSSRVNALTKEQGSKKHGTKAVFMPGQALMSGLTPERLGGFLLQTAWDAWLKKEKRGRWTC